LRVFGGTERLGMAEFLGGMVEERNLKPHVALWDRKYRRRSGCSINELATALPLFATGAGTIVWLTPRLSVVEIDRHVEGR